MIVVLIVALVASFAANAVLLHRFYLLGVTVLDTEDAVERCLDEVDSAYQAVGRIVSLPLATNDPKVLQIHGELKRVHVALLRMANRLTSGWSSGDDGGRSETREKPEDEPDRR